MFKRNVYVNVYQSNFKTNCFDILLTLQEYNTIVKLIFVQYNECSVDYTTTVYLFRCRIAKQVYQKRCPESKIASKIHILQNYG